MRGSQPGGLKKGKRDTGEGRGTLKQTRRAQGQRRRTWKAVWEGYTLAGSVGLQGHPQGERALRPAHWEDRGREWDRAVGRKGLRTEGERRNRDAYDDRSTGRKQHVPTGERTLSPGTEDAGLSSPHLSGKVTANYYRPSGTRAHRDPCQQRAAEHHSETMSCQPTGLVTSESQTLPGATVGSLGHPVKLSPRGRPQRGSTSTQ